MKRIVGSFLLGVLALLSAAATAAALWFQDVAWDLVAFIGFRIIAWQLVFFGLAVAAVAIGLACWAEGAAAPAWRQRTARMLPVFAFLVLGGAWGWVDFPRENATLYNIERRPDTSLAELAAGMPDRFRGRKALLWLRWNAPGVILVGVEKTLTEAALAPHRVVGVALSDVRLVRRDPVAPARALSAEAAARRIRLDEPSDETEVWLESGDPPLRVLCAAAFGRGVLLVRAGKPEECTKP